MTDWVGHALKNHMTSLEQWEREWRETVPHVSEPWNVNTQLLCHKSFIWLHPHFMVRVDDHESVLLPHLLLCNFRRFLSISRLEDGYSWFLPRDHMPLTMDLVTNGMRQSPDPTRGRWDHEKIEEMLSDPVARLTFFKELETKIRKFVDRGTCSDRGHSWWCRGKSRADNSRNRWSLRTPGSATTYSATCFGTKTSVTGTWHSTTSDRLLRWPESWGECKDRDHTSGETDSFLASSWEDEGQCGLRNWRKASENRTLSLSTDTHVSSLAQE